MLLLNSLLDQFFLVWVVVFFLLYQFLINNSIPCQLATVAILLYSALAAIYYARYTYFNEKIPADYDEPFITRNAARSAFVGLDPGVYQNIMDAVDTSYDFENDWGTCWFIITNLLNTHFRHFICRDTNVSHHC